MSGGVARLQANACPVSFGQLLRDRLSADGSYSDLLLRNATLATVDPEVNGLPPLQKVTGLWRSLKTVSPKNQMLKTPSSTRASTSKHAQQQQLL
eukprot:4079692-Amphidinium_carterae.1